MKTNSLNNLGPAVPNSNRFPDPRFSVSRVNISFRPIYRLCVTNAHWVFSLSEFLSVKPIRPFGLLRFGSFSIPRDGGSNLSPITCHAAWPFLSVMDLLMTFTTATPDIGIGPTISICVNATAKPGIRIVRTMQKSGDCITRYNSASNPRAMRAPTTILFYRKRPCMERAY